MVVTQGYLVATTVILAWNLSKFDEWTCWALLVALAFWDLCAVLTPCGPLQMLVGLMQQRNEPLPGLLYEAQLPPPPEQLRHYHSMGRTHGGSIELQTAENSLISTGIEEDDEHYSAHTEIGAERMFPRRIHNRLSTDDTGNPGGADKSNIKIPFVGAVGVGVIGLGMMANGKKRINSRDNYESSASSGSHYSDVELSEGSLDRSDTALRVAQERDDGPVRSSRVMDRQGHSAASPPVRVTGGREIETQGIFVL